MLVRPAGRTNLEVQVLYTPVRGKCWLRFDQDGLCVWRVPPGMCGHICPGIEYGCWQQFEPASIQRINDACAEAATLENIAGLC